MPFDPNATATLESGIFALPFSREESQLVLIPVPWDVTTSYGRGTHLGPNAVMVSSHQLDLCDPQYGEFYKSGIFMESVDQDWLGKNKQYGDAARKIQDQIEAGKPLLEDQQLTLKEINSTSKELNNWLKQKSLACLKEGRTPCVVGGDHSSPFGLIDAYKDSYQDLSILHIDAHCDLRKAYQGFEDSHASIMRNVVDRLGIDHLVQIGIRDYCPEERDFSLAHESITTFFDGDIQRRLHFGESWATLCNEFFKKLSPNVYISFDIDGLTPDLCPNTGTPVPGGISFAQISTLLAMLKNSGRNVVGFDLCEVAPEAGQMDCWDGNVGARILFKLCGTTLET